MIKHEVVGHEGGVPPIYIEWRDKPYGKVVASYRSVTDRYGVIHRSLTGSLKGS